jgi:hypothetical protein
MIISSRLQSVIGAVVNHSLFDHQQKPSVLSAGLRAG